jgi:dehydrogenase/reductase SDR family protein 1
MFGVGVRSQFVTSRMALPLMLRNHQGVIVSTQERPGDDDHFGQNIVVDAASVAMQRMTRYLARELDGSGVTALLVYLGWVRTVNMGMGFDRADYRMSEADLVSQTQSPALIGRGIAMLAAEPNVAAMSGQVLHAGALATRYGFTDIDGRVPPYEGSA